MILRNGFSHPGAAIAVMVRGVCRRTVPMGKPSQTIASRAFSASLSNPANRL